MVGSSRTNMPRCRSPVMAMASACGGVELPAFRPAYSVRTRGGALGAASALLACRRENEKMRKRDSGCEARRGGAGRGGGAHVEWEWRRP